MHAYDAELEKSATIQSLWELENVSGQQNNFRDFMRALTDLDRGGTIDEVDIDTAISFLNGMLQSRGTANLKLLLQASLSKKSTDPEQAYRELSYLCNKMRTIFAMEPGYSSYTLDRLFALR